MEKEDMIFDKLIEKISLAKPELFNENELTENIMLKIELSARRSAPKFLILARTISGAAAIFLIGLYIFQQNEPVITNSETTYISSTF